MVGNRFILENQKLLINETKYFQNLKIIRWVPETHYWFTCLLSKLKTDLKSKSLDLFLFTAKSFGVTSVSSLFWRKFWYISTFWESIWLISLQWSITEKFRLFDFWLYCRRGSKLSNFDYTHLIYFSSVIFTQIWKWNQLELL